MIVSFSRRPAMLNRGHIRPTISVTKLERARRFYGDTLGLNQTGEVAEGHILYEAGDGTSLLVYERPDPPKAENTVASFNVEDLDATVEWLRDRGVVFEEYDLPGLKTVNGIAEMGNTRGAWFKDPDGNILAVSAYLQSR
jgi:catechol 2,3-dioxygenase-like lactoylglutathione lyase family enzyme